MVPHSDTRLQPWMVLSAVELVTAPRSLRVTRETVRLPNGESLPDFSSIELPDYMAILALAEDHRVLGEQQYEHGRRCFRLPLPAGYLEPGENPPRGTQRELREETGYYVTEWQTLVSFVVDDNRGCG